MNWSIAATGVSGTVLFAMLVLIFKAGRLIGLWEQRMDSYEERNNQMRDDISQLQRDVRRFNWYSGK